MEGEQPSSVVCIKASEVFPKKSLKADDLSLQVLFPELEGEYTEFLGSTSDATLALSNFRLFISFKDSFLNLPLYLVESVELKDLFILQVNCKDARSFRICFDNNEQCVKWLHRLSTAIIPLNRMEELFSFVYYGWTMESKTTSGCCSGIADCNGLCLTDGSAPYSFFNEVQRLGFDTHLDDSPWRITDINSKFEICSTYPKLHVVPKSITDNELETVASFRCARRFPSVVWRHVANGAVIARCSQPEVGWFGWRSAEDEKLLQALGCVDNTNTSIENEPENSSLDKEVLSNGGVTNGEVTPATGKRVLIVDARSYTAAVANRAKGGGCECTEYYPNCEVEFMNLGNIHTIRKSFHLLRNLCSGPQDISSWWSQLEKTNWLQNISMLFKAAITVVNTLDKYGRSVLVHCSDGWDRTTQIVALAELLLDPYYRTIEGFKVLVEREWLEFGHRFADRCGHGFDSDENQRCPVFVQWLDCVHQLLRHFPCAFEFNETFLCKLVQHTYSCLFGTFLCNSESERQRENVKTRTFSVWSLLHSRRKEFRNLLYSPNSYRVLFPSYHVRSLVLWSAVYLAYPTPFVDHRDSELHADSPHTPSSSSSSSSSPRFPFNYSDSNLETKPSATTGIISSKSDGDLLRNHMCKTCNDHHLDHLKDNRSNSIQCRNNSPHSKNGSLACNGDADHPDEEDTTVSDSLYFSTTTDKSKTTKNSYSDGAIAPEMNSSMSSSGGTLVQDGRHSDDSESEDEGEGNSNLSDANSCGKTRNFSEISQSKQDSSSYEHLSSLSELDNTSENNENEIKDSKILDKKISESLKNVTSDEGTSVSAKTQEDEKTGSTKETHTSESATTIKPSPSNMYARYLDNDGLTLTQNDVQDRLRQMNMAYQDQLDVLRAMVMEERRKRFMGIVDAGGRSNDLADEVCSLPDSTQSGEQPPLSNGSGDESSWIEVEENDAEPTRWVPDHVATNCANCDAEFWIANRKHHCRNCGQVFCSSCSNHNLPVPNEQLYDPVRVCMSCFEKLVYMEERQKERRRNPEMVSAVG